jgi:hypothetical protein
MVYQFLADAVVVMHFGFIGFALLGGFLVARWKSCAWIHAPAFLWAALVEDAGWVCPLTPLENWLRAEAARPGFREGFVEHYLLPLLYPEMLTRSAQILAGLFVLIINLAVYARVFSSFFSRGGGPNRGVQ